MQDPTAKPGVLIDEIAEAFPAEYNSQSTLVGGSQRRPQHLNFEVRGMILGDQPGTVTSTRNFSPNSGSPDLIYSG